MFCPPVIRQLIIRYKVRTFKGCSVSVAMTKREGMRIGKKAVRK